MLGAYPTMPGAVQYRLIRRFPQVHVKEGIRSPQPPETLRPPFGSNLHALGIAQKTITELRRKQIMNRRRIVLEEKTARNFLVEQIVIVIVKT